MLDFGKLLLGLGFVLIVIGAVFIFGSRLGLPIGRLPGDIQWRSRSGNTQVYFPIATSIVLSILFSLIMWLLRNFRR